jgi:hypothetical protein
VASAAIADPEATDVALLAALDAAVAQRLRGVGEGEPGAALATLTADLMESLEGRYGEDSEIGDVCLIVEVVGQHGSEIVTRSSSPRRHVSVGLLRVAGATFQG